MTSIGIIASKGIGGGLLPPEGVPVDAIEIPFVIGGINQFNITFSTNLSVVQFNNFSNGGIIFQETNPTPNPIIGGCSSVLNANQIIPSNTKEIYCVIRYGSSTNSPTSNSQLNCLQNDIINFGTSIRTVNKITFTGAVPSSKISCVGTQRASTGPLWPTGIVIEYIGYTI